jgi:hypothetical protein
LSKIAIQSFIMTFTCVYLLCPELIHPVNFSPFYLSLLRQSIQCFNKEMVWCFYKLPLTALETMEKVKVTEKSEKAVGKTLVISRVEEECSLHLLWWLCGHILF